MVMKKNTIIFFLSRSFVTLFIGFAVQSCHLNAKTEISKANGVLENSTSMIQPQRQGVNLLKGIWGRTEGPGEINISEVVDNGVLKATFYNPKLINIEKAVWTNSSDVLRIYILLREDNYLGSSFSLNYIAEKDILLGVYFDALTNESYTTSFKRVK